MRSGVCALGFTDNEKSEWERQREITPNVIKFCSTSGAEATQSKRRLAGKLLKEYLEGGNPVVCKICQNDVGREDMMEEHMREHSGTELEVTMEEHMREHSGTDLEVMMEDAV